MFQSGKFRTAAALLAGVAFASLALAGCSSSSSGGGASSGSSAGASKTNLNKTYAPGVLTLAQLFKGTSGTPPTSGPKAAKNKTVYYLNCGEQVQSCNSYANGAKAAAKVLGWNFHEVDAKLNQANGDEKAMETAVAAHPDAIIQDAFSCQTDEPGLEKAKAAHIPVIGVETLDCSDTGGPQLFTVPLIYSNTLKTQNDWWTNFGKYSAAYLIDASGGKAQAIVTFGQGDPQFTDMNNGFKSEFAKCSGCKILQQVPFTPATQDLWLPSFKSALVKHPTANWTWVPFDSLAVESGGAQALKESGVKAQMVSNLGESSALTLVRSGLIQGEGFTRDPEWQGWAALDELNRFFHGQKPVSENLGLISVDKTHNMPSNPKSDYTTNVDYKAAFEKLWGTN